MLDEQSQAFLNACQFWSFIKLPIHWNNKRKKLIALPPSNKDLFVWYCCIFVAGFGTMSSMFVSVTQVINRDRSVSLVVIVFNVIMVVGGFYTLFIGWVFFIHAKHTVFFWVNLKSFEINIKKPLGT
jgi:ABC-type multidrug transport system fused ATPase/permease subunit